MAKKKTFYKNPTKYQKRYLKNRKKENARRISFIRGSKQTKRYPYENIPKVGSHYFEGRYLHYAPNLPKQMIAALNQKTPTENADQDLEKIYKESEKYIDRMKRRKSYKAPSVKAVRDHLQHMVNFSISRHEKDFHSAYPLLNSDGKKLDESDDESEDDNKRGVIDHVKNAKNLAKNLNLANTAIPIHRK